MPNFGNSREMKNNKLKIKEKVNKNNHEYFSLQTLIPGNDTHLNMCK